MSLSIQIGLFLLTGAAFVSFVFLWAWYVDRGGDATSEGEAADPEEAEAVREETE